MFFINDIDNYNLSIYYYIIFYISMLLPMLIVPKREISLRYSILSYNEKYLFKASFIFAAISAVYYYPILISSAISGQSAYHILADTQSTMRALVQILSFMGMIAAAISYIYIEISNNKNLIPQKSKILFIVMYWFMTSLLIGDKGEILSALIFFICVRSQFYPLFQNVKLAVYSVLSLTLISSIDFIRGFGISQLYENFSFGILANGFTRIFESNETIAAHISMYGVINFDVPVQPVISFNSFLSSLFPRFLGFERAPSSYEFYSRELNLATDQGFTIHHATGWYINGGLLGLGLGGLFLGIILTTPYMRGVSKKWSPILIGLLIAMMPHILRAGPEGYKSLILAVFPIWLLLYGALRRRV